MARKTKQKTLPLKPQKHSPHIRWMISRDMPEVLQIEGEEFPYPWSEDDFVKCLRHRNRIGMVAEHDERIVGYMIYELHSTRLELLNFAVQGWYQRQGVGSLLMAKLIGKLSSQRRTNIRMKVWERNVDGQLFLRAMGFDVIRTEPARDARVEGDDEYVFEYRYGGVELT